MSMWQTDSQTVRASALPLASANRLVVIVHGVDLYPPVTTWVPENCHLEVDDISKPWTWPHKFDLIHIRFMLGSLTEDEWTTVYSEAYKYLNPGGWIEHIDCGEGFNCDDGSVPPHAAIWQWGKWMEESGHRSGKPMDIIRNMRQSIENAGFVNVHQKDKKSPQGRWPKNRMLKDVGELQNQAVLGKLCASVLLWRDC